MFQNIRRNQNNPDFDNDTDEFENEIINAHNPQKLRETGDGTNPHKYSTLVEFLVFEYEVNESDTSRQIDHDNE